MTQQQTLDQQQQDKIEAAVFRRLVAHLQSHTEVQNIDLMNLAGFCRNCLSKWYRAAAEEEGIQIEDAAAREHVYGMPYAEWKEKHQQPANKEQLDTFATKQNEKGPDA